MPPLARLVLLACLATSCAPVGVYEFLRDGLHPGLKLDFYFQNWAYNAERLAILYGREVDKGNAVEVLKDDGWTMARGLKRGPILDVEVFAHGQPADQINEIARLRPDGSSLEQQLAELGLGPLGDALGLACRDLTRDALLRRAGLPECELMFDLPESKERFWTKVNVSLVDGRIDRLLRAHWRTEWPKEAPFARPPDADPSYRFARLRLVPWRSVMEGLAQGSEAQLREAIARYGLDRVRGPQQRAEVAGLAERQARWAAQSAAASRQKAEEQQRSEAQAADQQRRADAAMAEQAQLAVSRQLERMQAAWKTASFVERLALHAELVRLAGDLARRSPALWEASAAKAGGYAAGLRAQAATMAEAAGRDGRLATAFALRGLAAALHGERPETSLARLAASGGDEARLGRAVLELVPALVVPPDLASEAAASFASLSRPTSGGLALGALDEFSRAARAAGAAAVTLTAEPVKVRLDERVQRATRETTWSRRVEHATSEHATWAAKKRLIEERNRGCEHAADNWQPLHGSRSGVSDAYYKDMALHLKVKCWHERDRELAALGREPPATRGETVARPWRYEVATQTWSGSLSRELRLAAPGFAATPRASLTVSDGPHEKIAGDPEHGVAGKDDWRTRASVLARPSEELRRAAWRAAWSEITRLLAARLDGHVRKAGARWTAADRVLERRALDGLLGLADAPPFGVGVGAVLALPATGER